MSELEEGRRAFSTFRVLNGDSNIVERDQLFRNMAQLYSYVSDRCDDEQVAQYDEVLCQLAELVEQEARIHVAKLLAPLDRAPGNVVVKQGELTLRTARLTLAYASQNGIDINRIDASGGVTVNCVLPGSTRTEGVDRFVQDLFPGLSPAEAERRFMAENRPTSLLQRLIDPAEIADLVAFVCSPRASAINGAALRVDGGLVRSIV